jgi:hypothetical protein
MATIAENIQQVRARIAAACEAERRVVQSVTLLAVSKTFGVDAVREAFAAGLRCFGENYVQEGVDKILALDDLRSDIAWHLVGPLQSNKTRVVAERFDWVHGIDRLKVAERLAEQRPAHLPPLQICLQVNISGEPSKSGFSPQEVSAVAHAVAGLSGVRLRGLMAIPQPVDAADTAAQRRPFAALRELLQRLQREGLALDTLSMGMSADLEAAVAEGATIVRVGTAVFGGRVRAAPSSPMEANANAVERR